MGEKESKVLHVALLLLLLSPPPAESFIFTAIATAIGFAYQAYQIINDAHDTYKKFAPQTTLDDVLDQAKKVEAKVDKLGAQLSNQINQAVTTIITQVDDMNNIREGLNTLSQGVRRIDNLYRLFELYTSKRVSLNNHTLQNYINEVTTVGALAPKDILNEIHDLIIPGGGGLRRSLLYYLAKDGVHNETIPCGSGKLSQDKFYQIFKLIVVNEIRAFTMMSFAYSMDQVFKCESFKGELELAEYELRERALDYHNAFSEVIDNTANSIRNCDPAEGWIRGKNFYEFDRFKSEYFITQTTWFPQKRCDRSCDNMKTPLTVDTCDELYGCYPETKCEGNLIDCVSIDPEPLTVCQLGPQGRRFQWFSTRKKTWGDSSNGCDGKIERVWERYRCDICWCTCIEDSYKSFSLRTFSLRDQLSDIENNKVVTGVKFVVKENMTHIQIQQGKVLPEGKISMKGVEWKPLEQIRYDREKTLEEKQSKYYLMNDDGTESEMKENDDFSSFKWNSHKIYLDSVKAPIDYIITGVRFGIAETDGNEEFPIQLEVQASPFDYDTGKIVITDDKPSIWLTGKDMVGVFKEYDEDRERIKFASAESPEKEKGTHIPRPSINTYIEVGETGYAADAGQITLPFLDAQEVAGKPPFAASAIGFYFKSITEKGGGFLGFRIWELESMKYLHIDRISELDTLSQRVVNFKGCNDDL